jgi:hypothetical protein
MAQRDYEEQPEAPDLGATVQLETSESLVGPPGDVDALDAGYSPPDRPYALDDDELTVAGQREGETLDERLAREEPEEVPTDLDRAGRLTDAGQGAALERADAVDGQDVGIDGGAASAEEAAVHVVDLGTTAPDDEGQAPVDDELAAQALTADPTAGAARVDAVRDLRATDEGSDEPVDDPETGPREVEEAPVDRGADRSGTGADPAYPHGGERDPALPDPPGVS